MANSEMPLSTYFGVFWREVGDQLVVDRQVRREHEEIVQTVREMQIGDERAHQARLADARGQRETERRELALEVGDCRELAANGGQRGVEVAALLRRDDLGDAVENFERTPLRRAKAQAAGDGVDVTVHHLAPSIPNRSA